ncbi:hypothetical protein V1639_08910 [Pseudarthrobacter sp. J75]|uniref:hypothetical protein n=1 Tax=Pseudarthrobacter sp. J75 TaxID=3116486 RepID=UPI002E812A73|nr:hypothetical protein [Pseudarthrobacter sp. J75]MEE2529148.1 hypothetical protein [Pseudarthrobacter sp. J75]
MATDALDPGPNGDYPHMPRNADGTLDTVRMPIHTTQQRTPDGRTVLINLEPMLPDGRKVSEVVPTKAG